jgi:hypothetical protein
MSRLLVQNVLVGKSQWTGTVCAVAAIALLVGCSGGSQLAPTAIGGSGASDGASALSSMHNGVSRVAPLFASKQANDYFLHRPIVNAERGRVIVNHPTVACKSLVFASSNITSNLLVYCGQRGAQQVPSGETPAMTIVGVAGWGVAVHGNKLAVGAGGGLINLYHLPSMAPFSPPSVTLSNTANNAYGLAFDPTGGLYATEFPSGTVDYWLHPVVGPPHCTWATTTNTEDYYVDAHGSNSALVYGFNGNSQNDDVDTERVTGMATTPTCAPVDTFEATFGQLAVGTGFPGGIVSHRNTGELYVNNQYGTLYNDGVYPGGPPTSNQCSWGFNPNDITNISMASHENSIWASNIYFPNSTVSTNLQSFKDGTLSGPCVTPAPSGGPMATVPNDEFLGVAAWPNVGN